MSNHWWHHALHQAHRHEKQEPKAAAIIYIVIGFFFAPMLIGIPIMLYGFYKLSK